MLIRTVYSEGFCKIEPSRAAPCSTADLIVHDGLAWTSVPGVLADTATYACRRSATPLRLCASLYLGLTSPG
jgi:hypothetical protein